MNQMEIGGPILECMIKKHFILDSIESYFLFLKSCILKMTSPKWEQGPWKFFYMNDIDLRCEDIRTFKRRIMLYVMLYIAM